MEAHELPVEPVHPVVELVKQGHYKFGRFSTLELGRLQRQHINCDNGHPTYQEN